MFFTSNDVPQSQYATSITFGLNGLINIHAIPAVQMTIIRPNNPNLFLRETISFGFSDLQLGQVAKVLPNVAIAALAINTPL